MPCQSPKEGSSAVSQAWGRRGEGGAGGPSGRPRLPVSGCSRWSASKQKGKVGWRRAHGRKGTWGPRGAGNLPSRADLPMKRQGGGMGAPMFSLCGGALQIPSHVRSQGKHSLTSCFFHKSFERLCCAASAPKTLSEAVPFSPAELG